MPVKYLVTGAAGHLGKAVVTDLLQCGMDDIRVLVMPDDPEAADLPGTVEKLEGDILDKETLQRFFTAPNDTELVVLHCAGIVSTSMKPSKKLYEVNVTGTKNIVDACVERSVKKLVYVSSIHAMPTLPRGQMMREIERFDPARVIGPYAKTKAEATTYVRAAAENGLDASIVYPCGIIGPYDQGRGNLTQMIIEFCTGRLPVGLKSRFDFVDVRDVAAGIVSAAHRGGRGEGYILGNRQISIPEMFELLHRETGRKRTRFFAPMWLAKAGLPFALLAYRLRRRRPLFCSYSLHTLSCNSLYSHDKAARELGYRPRPFEETIRDTVAWLKGKGRI